MDFVPLAVAGDVADYFRLGITHSDAFAASPLAQSDTRDSHPCFEHHDLLVFEALVFEDDKA